MNVRNTPLDSSRIENKIGTNSLTRITFLAGFPFHSSSPSISPAQKLTPQSMNEIDLAVSVLNAAGGDPLVAIRSVLADADFLRDQLWIASNLMSKGIGRGWRPQYERLA